MQRCSAEVALLQASSQQRVSRASQRFSRCRCRCSDRAERQVQKCRAAEALLRCSGAGLLRFCRGAEVQQKFSRCRCSCRAEVGGAGAEVQQNFSKSSAEI